MEGLLGGGSSGGGGDSSSTRVCRSLLGDDGVVRIFPTKECH